MSAPPMEYNLHDSVVLTTAFEEVGRLTLQIQLYEIYYPEESIVKLTISGIVNVSEVKAFHEEIIKNSSQKGWLGCRIDEIKRIDEPLPKADWSELWVSINHLKPLSIRCRKYRFLKIGK